MVASRWHEALLDSLSGLFSRESVEGQGDGPQSNGSLGGLFQILSHSVASRHDGARLGIQGPCSHAH